MLRFCVVSDEKEKQAQDSSRDSSHVYDDDTIERMKQYYKIEDYDELLKFIKTHGMRRHVDIFDEIKST